MKKFINSSLFGILILTALFLNACSAGGGQTGSDGGDDVVESSDKLITSFSFTQAANSSVLSVDAVGIISTMGSDGVNCITVTVPYGTNLTALKATFTTTGQSVSIVETVQTSGVTSNNFSGSSNVIYTVTAEDGTTYDYILNISVGDILLQWGSYGTGNGQFKYGNVITIDSNDNIIVLDKKNYRIQKFNSNGIYLSQFGTYGTSDGQFQDPRFIGVDSNNNIYVYDFETGINKFNSTGTYISKFSEYILTFKIDSNDNIFIVDGNGSFIQKLNLTGTVLLQWGSHGNLAGEFINAQEIDVDSAGNIYVTDASNARVQKFDSDGNFILQWGNFGRKNGQFRYPVGIAIDSNDKIYVADDFNNRIQKFDSNGNYLSQFEFDEETTSIGRIEIDSIGNIYLYDSINYRIIKMKM